MELRENQTLHEASGLLTTITTVQKHQCNSWYTFRNRQRGSEIRWHITRPKFLQNQSSNLQETHGKKAHNESEGSGKLSLNLWYSLPMKN